MSASFFLSNRWLIPCCMSESRRTDMYFSSLYILTYPGYVILYTDLTIETLMLFGTSSAMNMSSSSGKATQVKGFYQKGNASVVKEYPWRRFGGALVLQLRSAGPFVPEL